jgi:hypothetical protein
MKLDKGDQAPACGFFEEPSFLKLHHSNCDMRVKEKRHGQNYKKTIPFHGPISGILEQSKTKTYIDLAKEGIPEPEQEEDDSQGGGTRSECNTTSPLSTKRTRN